jgi:transposase
MIRGENQVLELTEEQLHTERLDHHGLVAAMCQELGIAEKLNARLGASSATRVVSAGTAVVAMILNGLGFTNRRLYLTHQFFEDKPLEKLLGEPLQASDMTDHTLGQALDEIAAYGSSQLFGEVAFEIALEQELLGHLNHLDTTSLSVHGEYKNSDGVEAIEITHGYSKDHRPDLKQVVLSLVVNGPSALPLWMEPLNGNSSDKTSFHETIVKVRAFQQQIAVDTPFKWLADSALYSKGKLLAAHEYLWTCRVPETIQEAKALVHLDSEAVDWVEQPGGYGTAGYESNYGDVPQRWVLVYSEQAYQREKKTLEKKLVKQEQQLAKKLWHLQNQTFATVEAAEQALQRLVKAYRYFTLALDLEGIERYRSPGRPPPGAEKVMVGYRFSGQAQRHEIAVAQTLNAKGRFILATNDLDRERYPDAQLLQEYKDQQSVERGFRFLKDPWFMVDSIFLKLPRRIEALMMVMTLCLLVYNLAQFRLRQRLKEQDQTLPNQLKQPVQNPTLRWIFQLMEGISIVRIGHPQAPEPVQTFITNLTELRKKIIRFFGDTACQMYGLIPKNLGPNLGM